MAALMVGSDEVWILAVGFCFGAFGRNLASVAVKMLSH
jgi:hypothetical protein